MRVRCVDNSIPSSPSRTELVFLKITIIIYKYVSGAKEGRSTAWKHFKKRDWVIDTNHAQLDNC